MKVLLVGTGLLGRKCAEKGAGRFDLTATYHRNLPQGLDADIRRLDITDREAAFSLVRAVSPGVIIHTAAYTDVDGCERDKEAAHRVNVVGTGNVALAARRIGAKLVYISTDYVFGGEKGEYKEEDAVNPINYYGKTKLEGENLVAELCADFIICRASAIFGASGRNFAAWVIDELRKGEAIRVITDQYVSPTLNTDLADQLFALIENNERGIFHTAGGERISRFGFATRIARAFNLDENLILPIEAKDLNWIARRPRDSSLDVSAISKVKVPLNVQQALDQMSKELK